MLPDAHIDRVCIDKPLLRYNSATIAAQNQQIELKQPPHLQVAENVDNAAQGTNVQSTDGRGPKKAAAPRVAHPPLRVVQACRHVAAAFVTVMVSGLNQPAQLIIFGNLLDSFNTADTAEAVHLVHFFALMYAVVGIQQLIDHAPDRAGDARRRGAGAALPRKYFAAVLSRPISWFDQSDQGAVGAGCSNPRSPSRTGSARSSPRRCRASSPSSLVWPCRSAVVAGVGVGRRAADRRRAPGLASRVRAGRTPRPPTRRRPRRPSRTRRSSTSADRGAFGGGRRREMKPLRGGVRARRRTPPSVPPCRRARTRRSSRASSTAPGPSVSGTSRYLIRQDMKRHDYCNYRRDASGDLREPNNKCISGGDVMAAFLCVLFPAASRCSRPSRASPPTSSPGPRPRASSTIDEADANSIAGAANA